ncbi:MAG TPA: DUF3592 domain-containing protein [Usitatibacter sp.]|nr:DUF3592 domain-containing protein [Usitatibacter sp.]
MTPAEFPTHGAAIVAGAALCAIALHKGWRCWIAGSWPTVPGEVIHSDTEDQESEPDGDGSTTTRYRAWVRYRYEVKGKAYVGRNVSRGFEWHWLEWTAKLVARRYPESKRVRVRYRPADPEDSTLESGVTLASIVVLAAGIALIAWGLRGPLP